MPRVLVTGCGGFVGRHFVRRAVERGWDVRGVDRSPGAPEAGEQLVSADLCDAGAVAALLDEARPDAIVHLAAQSSVRQSFDEPADTFRNNTVPAVNLLHAIRTQGRPVRLLAVGSADEYGAVPPEELPLRETRAVRPGSPYALAKSVQNQWCNLFHALYDVDAVATRSFNHTGPGQRDDFVLSSFARQIVETRRGRREPVLHVGNLDVRRDFLDVRDVCAAYEALLDRGQAGQTYNVCSGRSYRIGELLDRLIELAGAKLEVLIDSERLRAVDTPELRGDPAKIREATGWEPRIPIEDTLAALLDYWEEHPGDEGSAR